MNKVTCIDKGRTHIFYGSKEGLTISSLHPLSDARMTVYSEEGVVELRDFLNKVIEEGMNEDK